MEPGGDGSKGGAALPVSHRGTYLLPSRGAVPRAYPTPHRPDVMIPYEAYKTLHIFGVLLAIAGLGGLALTVANGATKETSAVKGLISKVHGVALFLILLGGFGTLARIAHPGGFTLPGWVIAKLVIWVVIGALLAVPYRKPHLARTIFWLVPLLGACAAGLAIYKPF